jgi:hypothetical protein
MYVSGDDPVDRDESVEPQQFSFIRVAAITRVFEYRPDFRRSLYLSVDRWILQFGPNELQSRKHEQPNPAESKQYRNVRLLWHSMFLRIDK